MKYFKNILLIVLLLFIYIIICAFSYVNAISTDIQNNVFRLHVIANSNQEYDQNLKYLVRDAILNHINSITKNKTKEEVILYVQNNLDKLQKIAQNVIFENGYNYDVTVSIGNFPFPTKKYGDITFPPGFYDALKIEIGKAEGKNWWCVMFPPLCFVDVTSGIVPEESKEVLKENMSVEEYNLLSENSNNIKIKFKIVEMFQNLNIKMAQK